MKIIFNNSMFFHQKYGGVTRYSYELVKELIIKNIDLEMFLTIHKYQYLKDIRKINTGFYLKRYPNLKILRKINNLIINNKIIKSNGTIIHDNYYPEELLKTKKNKILTIHDLIHEKFKEFYGNKNLNLRKKIISEIDLFICVSKKTKEDFINYYNIPENKIKVIYHGSNHLINLKNENLIKFDKPFILYVGSREKYKNFNLLLNAISISESFKKDFELICFGGKNFSDNEINLFKKLKINNNIKLVSGGDEYLKNLYLNATAFIFPSIYEGFGLPLIEAMSLGCPVIASNIKIFNEVCDSSANYFDCNSYESLKTEIENIVYSNEKRLELINKGKERAKKFTWQKCADNVVDVYKAI